MVHLGKTDKLKSNLIFKNKFKNDANVTANDSCIGPLNVLHTLFLYFVMYMKYMQCKRSF